MFKKLRGTVALVAAGASTLALAAPAVAQADYGSIAVNPYTGHSGVSYNYGTRHGAERRAKHECGQPKCRVALWVRAAYGAVVLGHDGRFYAGLSRHSRRLAYKHARINAHDGHAKRVAWVFGGY